ncbi:cytochrome P450, partial [Ceratobasidium sp. AG-I]
GYTIKKGTTIEANIWAIMRDPKSYPNPHVFDPTRFLTPTPNPDPRRFLFGFGRRVCPGQHVANNGAFTLAAAFMSVFKVVAGDDTMKEVEKCGKEVWRMFTPFGPLEPMPFKCTITPRDAAAVAVLETCKDLSAIN